MFLVISAVFLFNEHGLVSWYKHNRSLEEMKSEIDSLEQEQIELSEEKTRLESDPEYLEKIAREKYGMAKKGEKVYKVISDKQDSTEQKIDN